MNGYSPTLDRSRHAIASLALCFALASPGLAQSQPEGAAHSAGEQALFDLTRKKHALDRQRAEQKAWDDIYRDEIKLLSREDKSLLQLGQHVTSQDRAAAYALLRDRLEQMQEVLQSDLHSTSVDDAWNKLEALRLKIAEDKVLQYRLSQDRFGAEQLASLLNIDKYQFWLFGVLALATLLALILYDRKHELRRYLLGSRARAMGLSRILGVLLLGMIVLTAAVYFKGDAIYGWLLRSSSGAKPPWLTAQEELPKLGTEAEKIYQDHREQEDKYARTLADWKARQPKDDNVLMPLLDRYREQLQKARLQKALMDHALNAQKDEYEQYQKLRDELKLDQSRLQRTVHTRDWIKSILGVVLLGLTVLGGAWFMVGVQRRMQRIADTCPMCMGVGTLKSINIGGKRNIEQLKCENVLSQSPFQECEFTFNAVYREMTKLCFPTLGVLQSGKTFWASMVYRKLTQSPPREVRFAPIESRASADYDRIIEDIIQQRLNPGATQTDTIPPPLVFDFSDRDRPPTNILVNLFDYSGEMTQNRPITDEHRQRALDGDGFLFFLDPTYPSGPQAKALAKLREDLRTLKGLRPNQRLRAPIALCVSKLDLLPDPSCKASSSPAEVEELYGRLREIDPTGERRDLKTIQARSQAIARMRHMIWDDWEIEHQIDRLFGGRFMYFPMTPIGLDEPGETDLRRRNINPLYILEPLLWLLHMNGYKVLR